MRRDSFLGIAVVLAVVATVATGITWKVCCDGPPHPAPHPPASPPPSPTQPLELTGLIGSEKDAFFNDPDVQAELGRLGLKVTVTDSGSFEMAAMAKQGHYDFAFPASMEAADAIRGGDNGGSKSVFYSPLVVVTTPAVKQFLVDNGLVQKQQDGTWAFLLSKFLEQVDTGHAWEDLRTGTRPPALTGDIYLISTDPTRSSSGAFYLAMTSYLANGGKVVADASGVRQATPTVQKLFREQGQQANTSRNLYQDFQAGKGRPLIWTYESEPAAQVMHGAFDTTKTAVLYPDVDIETDHTLVALTSGAQKLADALVNDDKLIDLEVKFGFRPYAPANQGRFAGQLAQLKAPIDFAPYWAPNAVTQQPPTPQLSVLECLANTAISTSDAPVAGCPQ
ncbi:hypothetical protein ACFYNO_02195 [Kitasatospora sp. NPDC006697]|uniref:hypothetical protein n=1 Tax=Kitasatospora sp. NPDC006697 TaxID=3364020 RepID=UPI0036CF751A